MPPVLVLVSPAGPLNLGSIARVMKNFGLQELRLVAPHCDPSHPDARLMAVHAPEILDNARSYASLGEALADRERIVGTTARSRAIGELSAPETTLPWLLDGLGAMVFGPEDRGLSNEELDQCQRWITLPTDPGYPSLNLAQAVGICCYLLQACPVPAPSPVLETMARGEILEGFYDHLTQTLLEIGYLQPHTQARKLSKFRQFFNRAQPTADEITLLRGVLRQVRWANQQKLDED